MSDPSGAHHKSDDELLADAIPIDAVDDAEELEEIEALEEPTPTKKPSVDLIDDAHRPATQPKIEKAERVSSESIWKRKPNITGQGASHMKTFVCKLRPDALELLDMQVNQWLDQHPDYEVKFATTAVGDLVGKSREPTLFLTVWV